LNALNFLTCQVADHVEFVGHRIIDEHLVREVGWRIGISMRTMKHQDASELAGLDEMTEALIDSIEAAHEPDLDTFLAKSLLRLHDPPRGR
jgi:hypothetical protein